MNLQPFNVNNRQPVLLKQSSQRSQREVAKMFVIDRIEFDMIQQIFEIRSLDNDDAVRLQHRSKPGDDSVEIGDVRQDVIGVDDVGPLS